MPAEFTICLDDETAQALDRLAERTQRSRSSLTEQAIRDFVAVNAWQLAKIEAGMAAANRGEFAIDEEILWVRGKYDGC